MRKVEKLHSDACYWLRNAQVRYARGKILTMMMVEASINITHQTPATAFWCRPLRRWVTSLASSLVFLQWSLQYFKFSLSYLPAAADTVDTACCSRLPIIACTVVKDATGEKRAKTFQVTEKKNYTYISTFYNLTVMTKNKITKNNDNNNNNAVQWFAPLIKNAGTVFSSY